MKHKFKYLPRKGLRWGKFRRTYDSREARDLAGRLGTASDVATVIAKAVTEKRLRGSLGITYTVTLERRLAAFKGALAVRLRGGKRLQDLKPMPSSPERFTKSNPPKVTSYMKADKRYPGF